MSKKYVPPSAEPKGRNKSATIVRMSLSQKEIEENIVPPSYEESKVSTSDDLFECPYCGKKSSQSEILDHIDQCQVNIRFFNLISEHFF